MSEERPNADSMPAWAQRAFSAATSPPRRTPLPIEQQNSAAWPLLVDAAVVSAFLPKDLAPGAIDASVRSEAERTLLQFCEVTHGPDGPRWSLKRDVRAAVLGRALETGAIREALGRTAQRFRDPVSGALRMCLARQTPSVLPELSMLEAQRIAVSWLEPLTGLQLPSIRELDREIARRRLLQPFERMIGRLQPSASEHRFFGRAAELEQLREYVGVVGADSLVQGAQRALRSVRRALTRRAPLAVWGTGGVGKTTLLSKFMLEHTEAAASKFPFAFLDFDRATISARDCAGLLIEMCAQVATQFEALDDPMASISSQVREAAAKMRASQGGNVIALLQPSARRFCKAIDTFLERHESLITTARPFLLVLDTFEVAQYSEDDVRRLEEFIEAFSSREEGIWPRLRLIISGRKRIDDFLGPVEQLPVGSLDAAGSASMLLALAQDAGKTLGRGDAAKIVAAIARMTRDRSGGASPLLLRLVGDVFKEEGSPGAIVDSLLDELHAPLDATGRGLTAAAFVEGVLVRRVLGHVADGRVRALADPGLVVRRVTPEVISEVMAPGTPDPLLPPPAPGTRDMRPPWSVSSDTAKEIFEAFSKEVTLVEREGASLRHRADVRREMLPLIRARNRWHFEAVHTLAFDYYRRQLKHMPSDAVAAGEAIYHGLWLGKPLIELEALWPQGVPFEPRIDPDEFADDSDANAYLRAKGGEELQAGELRRLPLEVALQWLDRRATDLLGERRVDEAVAAIRLIAGEDYSRIAQRLPTQAVVARVLFRAGLWKDVAAIAEEALRSADDSPHAVSLLRTWSTVIGKSATSEAADRLLSFTRLLHDPLVRVEVCAHAVMTRISDSVGQSVEEARAQIDIAISDVPSDRWRRELRVLRLAIITARRDVRRYVAGYLEMTDRLPRDPDLPSLLARLMAAIDSETAQRFEAVRASMGRRKNAAAAFEAVDEFWLKNQQRLVGAIAERPDLVPDAWQLIARDHSDWHWVLGNSLARSLREADGPTRKLLEDATRSRGASDGLMLVQAAADAGRLLEMARQLTSERAEFLRRAPARYPQNIIDLAGALLRWHHTIVNVIGRSGREQEPE